MFCIQPAQFLAFPGRTCLKPGKAASSSVDSIGFHGPTLTGHQEASCLEEFHGLTLVQSLSLSLTYFIQWLRSWKRERRTLFTNQSF